jgi:hypothetical protein
LFGSRCLVRLALRHSASAPRNWVRTLSLALPRSVFATRICVRAPKLHRPDRSRCLALHPRVRIACAGADIDSADSAARRPRRTIRAPRRQVRRQSVRGLLGPIITEELPRRVG